MMGRGIKNALKPYGAAIISVFIAVFSLAAVSIISTVGKRIISKELDGVGLNGMSVAAYNSSKQNVTDINLYKALSEWDDVELLTPVLYKKGKGAFGNGKKINVMCWGISPMAERIVHLDRVHGRMLNRNDVNLGCDNCVIDESLAMEVYKRSNIVGKCFYLTVGESTRKFKVVGIVNKTSDILNGISVDTLPYFVYIPYSSMESMCFKNTMDRILINTKSEDVTEESIKKYVQSCRRLPDDVTLKISNLSRQRDSITKIVDAAFLALFAVSCVSIAVCGISVASGVNAAVVSSKHDIGIKISLGAGRANITAEFMAYSLIACLIGATGGNICGYFLLWTVNFILKESYVFDRSLLISGIFVTILLTMIFSAYPSYKASGLSPMQALNRE